MYQRPIIEINKIKYNVVYPIKKEKYDSPNIMLNVNMNGANYPFMFLCDTGSEHSYFIRDQYQRLLHKCSVFDDLFYDNELNPKIASGNNIIVPCCKRKLNFTLEDKYPFTIDFFVNNTIHLNIIGLKQIPDFMRWITGRNEFIILRK